MTKVILVGDIHARDKNPTSVKESYMDDIIDLLGQVAKLEKELEVDAVIWAGDVFDFPNPQRTSHNLVMRMTEAVQKFDNLHICIGNHDIRHDRLESIDETQPLGVLFRAGAKRVEGSAGWADGGLPLYIVNWQQDWHNPEVVKEAFADFRNHRGRDKAKSLVVTHAPIYPPDQENQLFDLVPTHGEGSISEAMGNRGYVYYGHIHEDHGFFESDGVTYGNVGALARGSLQEYNVHRKIQAALWDSESGFTSIELDHKPAEEVFNMETVQEKKDEKLSLESFLHDVGKSSLDISSTESVVAHIETLDVPKPVKKLATELLREVQ